MHLAPFYFSAVTRDSAPSLSSTIQTTNGKSIAAYGLDNIPEGSAVMDNSILILGLTLIAVVIFLMYSRAKSILQTWADENGYQILSSNPRFLGRGPYTYTLLGKQWVFHVVVRASDGTKSGYVKCGSFFWGVIVNKAEAILDG